MPILDLWYNCLCDGLVDHMHAHIFFFYTRDPQGTLFFIDRYTDEVVTLIHALIEHELTESGCSYVPPQMSHLPFWVLSIPFLHFSKAQSDSFQLSQCFLLDI